MTTYTLRSLVDTVDHQPAPDEPIETYIRVRIAIDRDGVEVDQFAIRFGMDNPNAEIRDALLAEIKERIRVDYLGVEQAALQARLDAIKAGIEDWSKVLP